ncbi:sensor histidine kinase [Sphingomonas psychrotolerans]|uniref:sensor histidine kinase n=1 Tax=Sphingomonas psychrotolerans TaxID=1327635 RepID=UPI0013050F7A|nr:ATP-binding protein [Sphingomonas psychrotolerans]
MQKGSRLALVLTGLAGILPAAILLGWSLQNPWLRGLGNPAVAFQPLLSFIFLLIVGGGLVLLAGHRRAARAFLLLPAALGALVLLHYFAGDFGIGGLLFGDQIVTLHVRNGGVPQLGALSAVTMAVIALYLLSSPRDALRRWAAPLASATLAATLLLVALTLTNQIPLGPRFVGPSALSGVPALLLSMAIIVQSRFADPVQPFTDSPWHTLQKITPAIIVLTILPTLVLVGLREAGKLDDSELYYFIADANLLVVVILLVHVTVRATEQNKRIAVRQAELDSILTVVPDALIVTGQDRVIRAFSAAAQRLWHCTEADACGTRIETLFAARSPDFDALLAEDPGIGKSESGVVTTTGRRSDGSEFPAELRVGAARQDGEVVHAAFVRDLSERFSLEDQVADLGLQLMQLSHQNALGELAGDIAHEINQPLAAASNYASAAAMALEKQQDHARAVEFLREISVHILRAGDIIRKLRSFLSHREVELRREELGEVVNDAVNLLLVGSRKLHALLIEIPASLPAVYVDRIQIQQVLVNLVRNAFEACDQGDSEPLIVIRARAIHDMVEVEITDNGPGLPEGFTERLGERFASSKGGIAGLGIGLNISKRIVEAHGGMLAATNRPGGGASFCFTIPSAAGFETPANEGGTPASSSS